MTASITRAGERLIAEKQAAHEVLLVSRFVLALVPDLDPTKPVDRDAPRPPAQQIVHTQIYTQKGFVNPNQVVYSLMIGSDIGDFDWNWIGLVSGEDVLLAVAYVPVQQKRKNIPPHQIGNNVTRNMLLVFDGAQALTDVTIDASTWQHDFTVRLRDIDERERLANRDVFGRACFFGDGLQLVQVEGTYQLKPGLVYVEGLRIHQAEVLPVEPPELPTKAYLDVALVRQENSVGVQWSVAWGEDLPDYKDVSGIQHYFVPLAQLADSRSVTDLRNVEPINGPLVQQFAFRNGDYKDLRARATTKADVELDQLPNAKSDDPATNSSEILATTKALNNLDQKISDSLVGMVAAFDMPTAPPGWLKRNGADVSRTVFAKLFAVIGTRYGAGDGSTTFNIGDSRGVFVRGLDEGRGMDTGRTLGSDQLGQNAAHDHVASVDAQGAHNHSITISANGEHAHAASSDVQGVHSHLTWPIALNIASGQGGGHYSVGASHGANTSAAGAHTHNISVASGGNHTHDATTGQQPAHTHSVTIAASGGSEARPVNQALLICIKY
jgi:microcystin-dependent protein